MNISSSQYFNKHIGQAAISSQQLSAANANHYDSSTRRKSAREGAYVNFSKKAQELYMKYIAEHDDPVLSQAEFSYPNRSA